VNAPTPADTICDLNKLVFTESGMRSEYHSVARHCNGSQNAMICISFGHKKVGYGGNYAAAVARHRPAHVRHFVIWSDAKQVNDDAYTE